MLVALRERMSLRSHASGESLTDILMLGAQEFLGICCTPNVRWLQQRCSPCVAHKHSSTLSSAHYRRPVLSITLSGLALPVCPLPPARPPSAPFPRYLGASQKSRQANSGESVDENNHPTISPGIKNTSSGLLRRSPPPPSASTASVPTGRKNYAFGSPSRATKRPVQASPAAATVAAAAKAGAAGTATQDSPIDISTQLSVDASVSESAKRPRVQGNPYPPPHRQGRRRPHGGESVLAGYAGAGGEGVAGARGSEMSEGGDGIDWEEAELLVVGEGGQDVPGRGRLDWCGPCRAHVLLADMEVNCFSFMSSPRHSCLDHVVLDVVVGVGGGGGGGGGGWCCCCCRCGYSSLLLFVLLRCRAAVAE